MEVQKGQCSVGCHVLMLKNTNDVGDRASCDQSALLAVVRIYENNVGSAAVCDNEVRLLSVRREHSELDRCRCQRCCKLMMERQFVRDKRR